MTANLFRECGMDLDDFADEHGQDAKAFLIDYMELAMSFHRDGPNSVKRKAKVMIAKWGPDCLRQRFPLMKTVVKYVSDISDVPEENLVLEEKAVSELVAEIKTEEESASTGRDVSNQKSQQLPVPPTTDPVEKLRKLKRALDEKLITNEEFEANKKLILEDFSSAKSPTPDSCRTVKVNPTDSAPLWP